MVNAGHHDESALLADQHFQPQIEDDLLPGEGQGGLNARYVFAAIRANLRLIILIFLGVFAITVIVTLLTTPRYKASADIQVNNSGGRFLKDQDEDTDNQASGSALDTERFLQTQVDVFKSRGMAERVSHTLNLTRSEAFFASQSRKGALAKMTPQAAQIAVVNMLMRNLTVDLPHSSRLMKVSFESNSPDMSALIVNTYVKEFIQFNLQRKFQSSSYAREFLANQLVEVKQKLEDSERALNAYTREAGLIRMNASQLGSTSSQDAVQQGGSITASSLNQLNAAYSEAQSKRIAAEARWNAISQGPLMSATEVVSNQGIQQLLTQRAGIAAALQQDRARHLEDYPSIRAGEAQLASVTSQIQTSANAIRNAVKSEYTAAVKAESELHAKVEQLKTETLNEQDRTVRYGLLAREVDTNRQVYDGLLQRYKELNASAGISTSNISVVDEAQVPLRPSSPDMVKNILIGLTLSIIAAALTLAIKDQFDDSIRIPEDIEPKINLPLLGVVPISNSGQPISDLEDRKSQVAEAYNSIRGSLLYIRRSGMPKVMSVTSAQPGEGKSTTSLSLAISLARTGKKVILIDADLRRPSLHRWLDNDNDKGLSSALVGLESLSQVMLPTATPNLNVVTSGPIPPSPTELFSGTRIQELLEEAKNSFDAVIIDSPPVLGLADAPLIAAQVDGVIFVVEADRSRRGSLKGALRRLRAVRPVILGAVLTKFDPLKSNNRYSSYYGYEYYQYQYGYTPNA
ncbi:GumC family protein [Novosphingobium humi]|uniref:non-specific protein-tyrosine kinase n=1 Tax=Novosphingobium humi TaxID=2282397 RepID=A0ABY7TXB7_9SPHN|nr:polysaccharide biosynthesis tyrosine autokinase [Novosphingobium humi]WCT77262.1 polysaccharide biosynthesis tyrosine autokinase [Novosphingobium humi]WJS99213.1 polysaccharide biosynthesis tyrosine autokinase [Novosphingobium humi]